jgi:hypothetical protein
VVLISLLFKPPEYRRSSRKVVDFAECPFNAYSMKLTTTDDPTGTFSPNYGFFCQIARLALTDVNKKSRRAKYT